MTLECRCENLGLGQWKQNLKGSSTLSRLFRDFVNFVLVLSVPTISINSSFVSETFNKSLQNGSMGIVNSHIHLCWGGVVDGWQA